MHWVKYFSPSIQCEEYFSLQIHWFKYFGEIFVFFFFCRVTLKTIALKIFTSNTFIKILCPNVLLYAESATLNAFIPNDGLESKCMFSIGKQPVSSLSSWWLLIYVILSLVSRDFSFNCIYSNNQFPCHLILIAFVITLLLKYTLIFSFLSFILFCYVWTVFRV